MNTFAFWSCFLYCGLLIRMVPNKTAEKLAISYRVGVARSRGTAEGASPGELLRRDKDDERIGNSDGATISSLYPSDYTQYAV